MAIYRAIDRRNWDALRGLLSPAVFYSRPGYSEMNGRTEFVDFYKTTRQISAGEHDVRAIIASESVGCCWGTFSGVLRNGDMIQIAFADWYEFERGLVRTRRTFFFPTSS
ncbi:nuclear transport factor 2 family protein [Pseudonocardia eucalypti]|uniref:nuclear transport factor 2 family protein n=1 Tax=Pseudonocardia eucalypti TaxID=648755 RepID=UPI003CD08348